MQQFRRKLQVCLMAQLDLQLARTTPSTHLRFGLLLQVIWEIPEELRRELSRLDSKLTLR